MDLPDAINQARSSIVQIRTLSAVLGTGFLVTESGVVVTALHVLSSVEREAPGAAPLAGVTSIDTSVAKHVITINKQCNVVDRDEGHDLALVQLRRIDVVREEPSGARNVCGPIRINTVEPRVGSEVATSGFPLGNGTLLTSSGRISTTWFHGADVPNGTNWFLADMKILAGRSGGPVYRVDDGSVIGVCKGFDIEPVRMSNKDPVQVVPSEGDPITIYSNAGTTVVVPIRFVVDLLARNNLV